MSRNTLFDKRIKITLIGFIILFIFLDFFPIFKSPDFRYTGSNPENFVWNLGTPYTLFIFDQKVSPYIFLSPLFYFIIFFQALLILSLKSILKLYYYQILPWLMNNLLFRKLASELTEIELTESGFFISKPFGGKSKSFEWNEIKNIQFSENKKQVIILKSDKKIILKNNNIGWYEFIQNVPKKFTEFDFNYTGDLINSLNPCGVCGIIAVNENKCIVCETIAWNKEMTKTEVEYIKLKQSDFYSELIKEGRTIKKTAEPEHGFKADKSWKLYI
jgi:hypothetical protein